MLEPDALEVDRRAPMKTYPIVEEFLRQQAGHGPRSFVEKFFGRNPVEAGERSLYRGAAGELAVVDALTQLGPDWLAFHSVTSSRDGGVVDHIAIGPPGAFTIAVKNHVGQEIWVGGSVVLVDGERVSHIRDAEFESVRAARELSDALGTRVDVTPCLVIVDPRSLTVDKPPQRVAILTPRELRQWLKRLPTVFNADQLLSLRTASLAKLAWDDSEEGVVDFSSEVPDRLAQFRTLQREVLASSRVRLIWITGGLLLVWLFALIGFATGLFI